MPQQSLFTGLSNAHQVLSDLVMVTKVELDPEKLTALTARLDVTIRHHFAVEDEVLYPTLLDVVDDWEDRVTVLGAHEDHRVIMRLLDDLENISPSDEHFAGKVHTLDRMWNHHVEEEEGALYDIARTYLKHPEFTNLSKKIRAAEKVQAERLTEIEKRQKENGEQTELAGRTSRQTRG